MRGGERPCIKRATHAVSPRSHPSVPTVKGSFAYTCYLGKRKIKCSGFSRNPCARCLRLNLRCSYSPAQPMGRPPIRRRSKQDSSMIISPSDSTSSSTNATRSTTTLNNNSGEGSRDFMNPDDPLAPPLHMPSLSCVPQGSAGIPWGDLRDFVNIFEHEPSLPLNTTLASDSLCQESVARVGHEGCESSHPASYLEQSTSTPSRACGCARLVQEHLSSRVGRDDTSEEAAQFISSLRESMNLTRQVLACQVCCNVNTQLRDVSGNVLLLGALMMMMTRACVTFIRAQRRRALEFGNDPYPVSTLVGAQGQGAAMLEFSLDRRQFWPVLGGLMAAELDTINSICDAMTSRQESLHEHGHEECRPSSTCRKNQSLAVLDPAEFCPRSVDSRSFFSCFLMIDHVRSVIREARQELVTT